MPSSTPPDELLGHYLPYEIDMLRETNQLLPTKNNVINNALIESFCIHARNLIEFFEKPKYVVPYQPFSSVPKKQLRMILRRINNQISHLGSERTMDDSKKINNKDRAEINNILATEILHFKAHLLQDYKHITIPDLAAITIPAGEPTGMTGSIGPQMTTTSPTTIRVVGPI